MHSKRITTKYAPILGTLLAITAAASARDLDVDWKFYGGASLYRDVYNLCFYDAAGVRRLPEGHIRVWTKCIPQKDFDSVDLGKDFGGKIPENVFEKIRRGYVPPIVVEGSIDFNDGTVIALYEEVANIGGFVPQAEIFFELNCSEQMSRVLSIYYLHEGKPGSYNKPGEWEYAPPEGKQATLLKILCTKQ